MIRLLRILGFLMIGVGIVVVLSYLLEPLRAFWHVLHKLPLPIQIGLGGAAAGLLLVLGTIIWERLEDLEADRELRDDQKTGGCINKETP